MFLPRRVAKTALAEYPATAATRRGCYLHLGLASDPYIRIVSYCCTESSLALYLVRSSWLMTLIVSEWRWLTGRRRSMVSSATSARNSPSSPAHCANYIHTPTDEECRKSDHRGSNIFSQTSPLPRQLTSRTSKHFCSWREIFFVALFTSWHDLCIKK